MPHRKYANQAVTTALTAGVSSSATVLAAASMSGYPATPYTIVIDKDLPSEEVCLVNSQTGLSLTVARGYDGTVAQSHSAGAPLTHVVVALDYREAADHSNATTGVHGLSGGSIVGTTNTQTVSNKTFRGSLSEAVTSGGTAVHGKVTASTGFTVRGSSLTGDKFTSDQAGNTWTAGTLTAVGRMTAGEVFASSHSGGGASLDLATPNLAKVRTAAGVLMVILGSASTFGSISATSITATGAITSPSIPRGTLGYVERTTTLAASTLLQADPILVSTVTMPADLGSRKILVQVEVELLSAVGPNSTLYISRNGIAKRIATVATAGGNTAYLMTISKEFTEVAGAAVTYDVRVGPTGANGASQGIEANGTRLANIRVSDVGAA